MTEEQRSAAMALLEGRRLAIDGFTWQGPSLTLVVQAFLLGVLTDDTVGWTVATAVAVAGVLACGMAMYALWLLHDREVHYSERVADHALALGLGDPRRARRPNGFHPLEWKGWLIWEGVLCAFVIADVIALIATR